MISPSLFERANAFYPHLKDAVSTPTLAITPRRSNRLMRVIFHGYVVGQNIEVLIDRREV